MHSVTKVPPFAADRGYVPPTPATLLTNEWDCNIASAAQVKERATALANTWRSITELVKQHEEAQQHQITERENKSRGSPRYEEGDEILIHWPSFRPYADLYRKQRLRYVGPFRVKRMVGENAIEVEGLPNRMPSTINTEYIHPYRRDESGLLASLRNTQQPPHPQQE